MKAPLEPSADLFHLRLISSGKFGRSWLVRTPGNNLLLKKELYRALPDKKALKVLNQIQHPALLLRQEVSCSYQKTVILRPWVEGSTLKELQQKPRILRRLSPTFWLKAFVHLSEGLEQLHAAGWLHGDIKPANILLQHQPGQKPGNWEPEQLCLIDFGQARPFPGPAAVRQPFALGYAPPEQLLQLAHLNAPSSDVFMLALCLYEVLTGKAAFSYHDPEMLLHLQLNLPLPPHPRLPQNWLEILQKATAREAFPRPPRQLSPATIEQLVIKGMTRRYPSAQAFTQALQTLLTEPVKHKKGWLATLFKHF